MDAGTVQDCTGAKLKQMKSMIVMMMNDVLIGDGGSERNLYQLARGLRDKGHKVIVCCMWGGNLSERMSQEGFIVRNLKVRRLCSYQGIKSFLKMMRTIRKYRVSAILSYHRDSDFMGFLLSVITGVPIVSTRRDMGYDRTRVDLLIYGIINRYFDAIATVSEAVKEAILTNQGARLDNVTVIHNGADLSSDANCMDKIGRGDGFDGDGEYVKIGCIANIRRIKGQVHFIDAAKLIFDQFRNVRFYLVGVPLDEKYYKEILLKVKEHGLEDAVRLTGPVANSRVPAVWKSKIGRAHV